MHINLKKLKTKYVINKLSYFMFVKKLNVQKT